MSIARRRFAVTFATAAAAVALFSALPIDGAFAQSAKYRLRYGTAFPADHPAVLRITEAAEAIKAETNGQVDIQVFPNSQMGSEPEMFSQVRSGALDFMSTSGVNQTVVPVASINAVAFAFADYTQVWAAMDGDLGAHVRAAFDKAGLHAFEKMLDNGYRNITTSGKPVNSPDDLKGLKIRVPGNPLWVSVFKDLGAAPTPIQFGELYASLQTRVVDGQENPMALIQSAKLYEVQKYIALTGHIWDGHYIFMGNKKWTTLPADVQASISKNFAAAAEKERADVAKLNEAAIGAMKTAGLTITTPDKKPFRDALKSAGFYEEVKAKYGDAVWTILEKYSGPL
ncbi:TRAP transporter substrate-binding protein [Azospirillum doebereinerae]|uniref:TRAP transporter substrate-binding protein n=1 Tax=Azospirillum doebereinerae TaxID=92933 RepID=A0A3S0WLB4_9PROT|nr:TRAP transporter substrate-binding protein [Azospirillum doebereinerae]RUQ69685.1 TRAP transporter substrate-binding protein [Azospirillum doebereinerae]